MEKTPLHIATTESFKSVIRCMYALPEFDRLGVALITRQPYGTVSRIFSEMANEGYIESTPHNAVYDRAEVKKNPDFYYEVDKKNKQGQIKKSRKLIWHYTSSTTKSQRWVSSARMKKGARWAEFILRWQILL